MESDEGEIQRELKAMEDWAMAIGENEMHPGQPRLDHLVSVLLHDVAELRVRVARLEGQSD